MPEEQIFKNLFPEYCAGERCLSPYFDLFQTGFEEGEKQQLTKAKEIIRELLNSCFGYNSKTVNYEVKVKAEQFLKEVSE